MQTQSIHFAIVLSLLTGSAFAKIQLSDRKLSISKNIQSIWFVRMLQIPSSRAFCKAPVYSFAEYMEQMPADHGQGKIIPVEPRPFTTEMSDGLALQQSKLFPVPLPIGLPGLILLLIVLRFSGNRLTKIKRIKC